MGVVTMPLRTTCNVKRSTPSNHRRQLQDITIVKLRLPLSQLAVHDDHQTHILRQRQPRHRLADAANAVKREIGGDAFL